MHDCLQAPSLDFRSKRFAVDARALVRLTGRTLDLCRQELFIAEGDAAEACEVLQIGLRSGPAGRPLH